jgi:hypothetical protein
MTTRTELIARLRDGYPIIEAQREAADMLEADAAELAEAESDLNEHWQIIEKFQIKEKELYAAAHLALNALLKKNGKWGQGHDELETKAIASLKSALEIKTDDPIK